MSQNKLPDVYPRTENGLLAKLWGKVIRENSYQNRLIYLISRYARKADAMSDRVKVVRVKQKFTLTKNVFEKEMTFKTFMDLLFNFLEVVKVDVTISLKFADGTKSVHTVSTDNKITTIQGVSDDGNEK